MTASSRRRRLKKVGGLPTWKAVLPIACILLALHATIVGSIMTISTASSGLTKIMQTHSGYIAEVTKLQGGASYLSESSSAFVLHPLLESGDLNYSPLVGYANELQSPRRGEDIKRSLESQGVDPEILQKVAFATQTANHMIALQLHAIALTLSVYPAPPIPALQTLTLPTLSAEEAAMSDEEKLDLAFDIITSSELSVCKRELSERVSDINADFRTTMQSLFDTQLKKVDTIRTMLWVATISVIVVLLVAFYLLIRLLVYPLGVFVRGIDAGTSIPEKAGLSEVRLVARSYNKLLARKDAFERALRSAAETDSLTDLPNRYYMEQYLLQEEEEGSSAAVFLFDVNFLKEINDRDGHTAGDELLKRVALCLTDTFAVFPQAKCFRYGGDEFVAILKKCNEEDIKTVFERFEEEQNKQNVSIAVGCAYAENLSATTIKELFDEADKKMYENKKMTHSSRDAG